MTTKQEVVAAQILSEWHLTHVHPSELPDNDPANCRLCGELREILLRLTGSAGASSEPDLRKLVPLDGGDWYYDHQRDICVIEGRKYVREAAPVTPYSLHCAQIRLDEARWWREQTARLVTTALHMRIMNERVENLEAALQRNLLPPAPRSEEK